MAQFISDAMLYIAAPIMIIAVVAVATVSGFIVFRDIIREKELNKNNK